jgi:hypothetical protein
MAAARKARPVGRPVSKTIRRLQENPSKADEISFFEAVVGSIPRESYLYQMFTREFALWVTESIRNDCDMDIHGNWEKEMESARSLNSHYVRATEEIKVLKNGARIADETISNLIKQSQGYKDQNAALLTQNDELVQNLEAFRVEIEAVKEHSEGRLKEMLALQRLLKAVVNNTSEEDKKLAQMLVRAWEGQ